MHPFYSLYLIMAIYCPTLLLEGADSSTKVCRNAASYCGVLDEKYPDKRPMGFPFDRPPDKKTTTLTKFIEKSPNITTTEIRIRFEDRVIRRYPR